MPGYNENMDSPEYRARCVIYNDEELKEIE
jgi:hypothetical protein